MMHSSNIVDYSINDSYFSWLKRFQNVLLAYRTGLILSQNLVDFQIFLLEAGQFNANFTLEELERLNYPKSPFAMMAEHGYLRATNTWPMQILSAYYCSQRSGKKVFPIWVSSDLFFEELNRYSPVINVIDAYDAKLKRAINRLFSNEQDSCWIEIDVSKVDSKKLMQNITLEVRRMILYLRLKEHNIPDSLVACFDEIWLQKKKQPESKIAELKKYFNDENYIGSVQNWCSKNVKSLAEDVCKKIVFFYRDQLLASEEETEAPFTMQAMVFFDKSSFYNYGCTLVNSLGYRIDPVIIIRNLLKLEKYHQLFFDATVTSNFWDDFNKTTIFTELSEEEPGEEKERLKNLQVTVVSELTNKELKVVKKRSLLVFSLESFGNEVRFLSGGFKIYGQYLFSYLSRYLEYGAVTALRTVADSEVQESINRFLDACRTNNLAIAVRAVQTISEVMQLDLMLYPLQYKFSDIVRRKYLSGFPVQNVSLTSYAMRAFVRVLQTLAPEYPVKIAATNQSYYELLENFDRLATLDHTLNLIRHVDEISSDMDLIFLELHPNNVLESKQFSHDPQELIKRIVAWNDGKYRTLVVDVTLNALNDEEVKNFLVSARSLINKGYLNVVLIQSLTKFAQLGLDKRSAGLIVLMNNGDHWADANLKFRDISLKEVVDPAIDSFFSFFCQFNDCQLKEYIQSINRNVRFVYKEVLKSLDHLEVLDRDRFSITMSSDPKSCYVAINMNGLIPSVEQDHFNVEGSDFYFMLEENLTERLSVDDAPAIVKMLNGDFEFLFIHKNDSKPIVMRVTVSNELKDSMALESFYNTHKDNKKIFLPWDHKVLEFLRTQKGHVHLDLEHRHLSFSLTSHHFQRFSEDLLEHLIYPSCHFLDLPLTARFSIGFPLTSVNPIYGSMRFTIGLESEKQLIAYSSVLSYVAFVLNRQRDAQIFFYSYFEERNLEESKKTYPLRISFFKEKANQFMAMTPGRNKDVSVSFEMEHKYNDKPCKMIVNLNNGRVRVSGQFIDRRPPYNLLLIPIPEKKIQASIRNKGNISIDLLDMSTRRMIMACLTEVHFPYKSHHNNVNHLIDNWNYSLSFPSFEIINLWNGSLLYGPFRWVQNTNPNTVFFILKQNKIDVVLNGMLLNMDNIVVKQGPIRVLWNDISLHDRAFLIRDGFYKGPDRSIPSMRNTQEKIKFDFQYIPQLFSTSIQLNLKDNQLIFERYFECCRVSGVSIYHSCLDDSLSCYEVDYWGEKDPVFSRFLRLMTAIYVKDLFNKQGFSEVGFKARNPQFTHFLFNVGEEGICLFREAVNKICARKRELKNLLQKSFGTQQKQYTFYSSRTSLSWPSRYSPSGVDYISNSALVEAVLVILNKPFSEYSYTVRGEKRKADNEQEVLSSETSSKYLRQEHTRSASSGVFFSQEAIGIGTAINSGLNHEVPLISEAEHVLNLPQTQIQGQMQKYLEYRWNP
ncbi:MAG: hypothetical protein KA508_00585 [Gammaproteobacteria bacterium]|nr:hypothetical protein [Gammaproteobacteria bacterium]